MRIKLICADCNREFECEKGKELRTNCPECGSGNVIIPMAICDHPTLQRKLR